MAGRRGGGGDWERPCAEPVYSARVGKGRAVGESAWVTGGSGASSPSSWQAAGARLPSRTLSQQFPPAPRLLLSPAAFPPLANLSLYSPPSSLLHPPAVPFQRPPRRLQYPPRRPLPWVRVAPSLPPNPASLSPDPERSPRRGRQPPLPLPLRSSPVGHGRLGCLRPLSSCRPRPPCARQRPSSRRNRRGDGDVVGGGLGGRGARVGGCGGLPLCPLPLPNPPIPRAYRRGGAPRRR